MSDPVVDVVIPAEGDASVASRCIRSILAADSVAPFAVIVVTHGSGGDFSEFARDARVSIVHAATADCAAAAIGVGVARHTERDVVVMRPDAEVTGDWLDRLHAHAANRDVGVVGTFTDRDGTARYESFSYRGGHENFNRAGIDGLFARINRGRFADVQAAAGPCVYVARRCIDARLPAAAVSTGDATIEWSRRAREARLAVRVAADAFVGGDRADRGGDPAAWATADRAAPDTQVHAELRLMTGRIDVARMAASPKPAIVFVSHAWGGGIRRYMNDVAQLVRDDADVLYLEPADADTVRLYSPAAADDFSAWFRLPDDLSLLARTLKAIGVARLHVHHVHGLPRSILQLPVTASLPYDCTLHDYYAICPQYHLADATGRFCTQHESGACAACGVQRSAQWDLDVRAWRTLLGDFLRGAARVIAPSRDVADRVARDLPGLSIDVWPHPESATAAPPRILRVVTLGLLSREKGLDVVAGCAEDVRRRGLPMVFRVLGSTAEPIAQWPDAPLTIHGSYEESSLPLLLAGERADVLLFPAQIPETYAYTLTTAMASGLPIVASSLGAFTERLAGRPRVRLVPWDATAAQWNAALMEVGRAHASDAGCDATVTAAP